MTAPARTLLFRLPRSAYLAVLFLLFCSTPLAFTAAGDGDYQTVGLSWRLVFLLLPILTAVFIARTATMVGAAGVRVRAVLGSRTFSWDEIRGLSVTGRAIYAVLADGGAVRLPCVRTNDLSAVAKVAGGRLPEVAEPVPKYAPGRARRRRVARKPEADAAQPDTNATADVQPDTSATAGVQPDSAADVRPDARSDGQ